MSITLAGRPLGSYQPLDIIDIASRRNHVRHDLGSNGEYLRNWDILVAFGRFRERSSEELIAVFGTWGKPEWSDQFNALRAGEALGLCLEHGIVERVAGSHVWRLLRPDLLFEEIGPARDRRSLRVRGHATPAEAREAHKLLEQEMRKRERRRLKAIEKYRPAISKALDRICRRASDHKLEGWMTRFIVGEHDTVAACRGLIEDSIPDMSDTDVWMLDLYLRDIVKALPPAPKPEPVSQDDLDELGRMSF